MFALFKYRVTAVSVYTDLFILKTT